MLFREGVSFRILYSIVSNLLSAVADQLPLLGEERANLSAILFYFILALPVPSI